MYRILIKNKLLSSKIKYDNAGKHLTPPKESPKESIVTYGPTPLSFQERG